MNPDDPFIHIPDKVPTKVALERTTHLAIGAHQDDQLTLQNFLSAHLDNFRDDALSILDSVVIKPESS